MSSTNFVKVREKPGIIYHKEGQVEERFEKLKPNIYRIFDGGGVFNTLYVYDPKILTEKLIQFKTGVVNEIMTKCDTLLSEPSTAIFKEMEVLQKMGVVLFGPPGTGKTCTAYLIMKMLSEKYGAICFDATGEKPDFIVEATRKVRSIQDNPVVVFIDEVENTLKCNETDWLSILDGGDSFNSFIFLGCTNFLNRIPRRFTERRSRISDLVEVKSLPYEVYKEYLTEKAPSLGEKKYP